MIEHPARGADTPEAIRSLNSTVSSSEGTQAGFVGLVCTRAVHPEGDGYKTPLAAEPNKRDHHRTHTGQSADETEETWTSPPHG
jgi:hypothetical protein